MADQLNYFFRFNSLAQAASDPDIAPYLTPTTAPLQPLTVYDIGENANVVPLSGYWLMILTARTTALDNHARLQFLLDRDLETNSPATCAILNNLVPPLQLPNLEILTGIGLTYCCGGLGGGNIPISNWILATGFWNDAGIWIDNAVWID